MNIGLFKIVLIDTVEAASREPTKMVTFLPINGYDAREIQRLVVAEYADQLKEGDVVRLAIEKIV
jgi:hypothetical protein